MCTACVGVQLGCGGKMKGALRAFVRPVCIMGGFMTRKSGSSRKGLVAADIRANVGVLTSASTLYHVEMEMQTETWSIA